MDTLLVHNPTAGDGGVSADELCRLIEGAGHGVRYTTTDHDWTAELHDPPDLVVVAGGDGTVRKVVVELSHRHPPMAIIPLGTANNVARALGIPVQDPVEAIGRWSDARPRWLDVPVVRAPVGALPFVEAVGGGIFADLVRTADRAEEVGAAEGGLRDARAILTDLLRADPPAQRWSIVVDGADVSGDYSAVEVVNTGLVGPNVGLSVTARPGDQALEVVAVVAGAHGRLAHRLRAAGQGELVTLEEVGWSGRTIDLVPPPGTCMHVDDEVLDHASAGTWRISLDPDDRVRVLC